MKNKKTILLIMLINVALLIEGATILSKPKILLILNTREEVESLSGSTSHSTKEKVPPPLAVENPLPASESSLDLELLGTAMGNIKDPIAFIKDLRTNKQGMYKIGNLVQEAKVVRIVIGEVTLDLNGKKEILRLSKRGRNWSEMNQNVIVLNKNNLLSQSADIYSSLLSIKVEPHYEAKKVVGMQVSGIPENSVINTTGIKNQDIVKSVNNQKIDSYQKALQVFNKVKNQSQVEVSLLRDGQPLNLSYRIAN